MQVIAWRGNSHAHLENTLEAVAAVPAWVSRIELDTRLTADGVLVAYHSPTMRVHSDPRHVAAVPFNEIRQKRILHRGQEYRIATVQSILESAPGREFILHVKREANVRGYVAAVTRLSRACNFHSNSEKHLEALRGQANNRGTYKSVYTPASNVLAYVRGYLCGHHAFGDTSALDDAWLETLRAANKEILVFAGNTESWMRTVVAYDVDGFLTSRFERAATVLENKHE